MCPVHQSTEIVPLVHAAYLHTIADADRHRLGQVDIVSDEQRATGTDTQYEALVARAVVIIGKQTLDEAPDFDPGTIVALSKLRIQRFGLLQLSLSRTASRNAARRPWLPLIT